MVSEKKKDSCDRGNNKISKRHRMENYHLPRKEHLVLREGSPILYFQNVDLAKALAKEA